MKHFFPGIIKVNEIKILLILFKKLKTNSTTRITYVRIN